MLTKYLVTPETLIDGAGRGHVAVDANNRLIMAGASGGAPGTVAIDQTTPGTTNLVALTSQGYSAAVTHTRTADVNAYTAGDVIGPSVGATAALTFTNMGPSAGRIMLTSASLEIDVAAIPSGMTSFMLDLYSVTPPSAIFDNVAWDLPAGDRASYLGSISLGAPADLGSTLYVGVDQINKQIKLAGTSLFAYLRTLGGYTPSSAAVKVLTLHAVGL